MNMNRELLLKIAPSLRKIKSIAIGLYGFLLMLKRYFSESSSKGTMVLLSPAGGNGVSVASAVKSLGYDLVVVSSGFPRSESLYAKTWIKYNPYGEFDALLNKVTAVSPIAILVQQENALIPIAARLSKELKLVDYGDKSHKTSTSKGELRKAIDEAGISNIPWCTLQIYIPVELPLPLPFIIKPEVGTGSIGITVVNNIDDFKLAMIRLQKLNSEGKVGLRAVVETLVVGRQFDVEGIYSDGDFFPLSITEEQYDIIDKSLPSSWYLFSPPIASELHNRLLKKVEQFTRALGVENGAFHCEVRVLDNGEVHIIDYSNRMGYPHLVSECCGYSFPEVYVQTMAGNVPDLSNLQQNTVFQRFVRSKRELALYCELMSDNPELVIQKNMLGSYVGGVATYARIALRSKSFDALVTLLQDYEIVPETLGKLYRLPKNDVLQRKRV